MFLTKQERRLLLVILIVSLIMLAGTVRSFIRYMHYH